MIGDLKLNDKVNKLKVDIILLEKMLELLSKTTENLNESLYTEIYRDVELGIWYQKQALNILTMEVEDVSVG